MTKINLARPHHSARALETRAILPLLLILAVALLASAATLIATA